MNPQRQSPPPPPGLPPGTEGDDWSQTPEAMASLFALMAMISMAFVFRGCLHRRLHRANKIARDGGAPNQINLGCFAWDLYEYTRAYHTESLQDQIFHRVFVYARAFFHIFRWTLLFEASLLLSWSCIVIYRDPWWDVEHFEVAAKDTINMMTVLLVFLTTFRSSHAYQRWWEARILWGKVRTVPRSPRSSRGSRATHARSRPRPIVLRVCRSSERRSTSRSKPPTGWMIPSSRRAPCAFASRTRTPRSSSCARARVPPNMRGRCARQRATILASAPPPPEASRATLPRDLPVPAPLPRRHALRTRPPRAHPHSAPPRRSHTVPSMIAFPFSGVA
jgi:hypothetical protein